MATTNSDGLGDAKPETKEDALGERVFGDAKAENAGDPKIVDYPSNSDDITDDITGDDDASDASQ